MRTQGARWLVGIMTLAALLPGCSFSSKAHPYVNAGSPKAPVDLATPWWQRGENTTSQASLFVQVTASSQRGGMRLRTDATGRMSRPRVVLPYPVTLADGREVMGWCIRYNDRVELTVIPSDAPLEIETILGAPVAPNSRGETLIYGTSSVRGNRALSAESGDQMWENGEVSHYPAILEWQESSGIVEYPYVTYVLRADMPTSALQGIARGLERPSAE